MWASLRTKGSGDPSSGCICNTAGIPVSVIDSHSACLNKRSYISWGLFSVVAQLGKSYLSQTEQWWHRSGFSNWQRSQNRIAERTQAVESHSRLQQQRQQQQQQQPPFLILDHRLTSWRGWMSSGSCTSFNTAPVGHITSTPNRGVLYLQSLCGYRWAGPWLASSGSPAETSPGPHAAAALCQSGTFETMWGRAQMIQKVTSVILSIAQWLLLFRDN